MKKFIATLSLVLIFTFLGTYSMKADGWYGRHHDRDRGDCRDYRRIERREYREHERWERRHWENHCRPRIYIW